ncbi:MAG: anaerobic sulfatase-maturation protein [Alistipes sp.]|nr:anaerobic sulfatase-maturation protein [Alistipes sp.]
MGKSNEIELTYGRPIYLMAKPVGAACNLRCNYCYYLEKRGLYDRSSQLMSDETLELFVKEYIESQTTPEVLFIWHGGEPLLRSIDFYERALELQRRYANGSRVDNCIQTNATLITEEWCRFFRRNNFLVGVSIDGPCEMHDTLRRTADGNGSFSSVVRGLRLLTKYGVEWNAMATVNSVNVAHPLEFYRFFRDELECRYLQFTPVVERWSKEGEVPRLLHAGESGGELTPWSVTAEEWGRFLCTIFDEWVRHDVGRLFVQLFEATIENWMGVPVGLCTMSKYCGQGAAIEHNGDVYACDHFVFPGYRLGNIHDSSLLSMVCGTRQREFGEAKYRSLPKQCLECRYEFACHGECPRNRFLCTDEGEPGLNYLCKGYYALFSHAHSAMDYICSQLEKGLSPASVISWIAKR